ncbi:MAG TPA: metalloregulator ArsR/SmtB family transcription factor [Actinomycetales bacterium]|jgi:DNA-binding transcriptional ArsR family regulator|nr:metalloregulator ArsR/SmtB family transcription factor [Actinomycetales bacterium]
MSYENEEAWTAMSDRTRRAIVMALVEGERTVGELADGLPVSQPAVSQHLKVLKHVGVVSDRAEGTRRIYRLNEAGVGALRDQLDLFWNRTMASFEQLMEEDS